MGLLEVSLLALALGMDATAVGGALGLKYRSGRQLFRISFHFGLFQALFPLAGALAGTILMRWIGPWDHWLVFIVLVFLGVRMIVTRDGETERAEIIDATRGWSLVGLSTAVSIDALGAGLALPDASVGIPLAVTIIGVTTTLMTAISMRGAAFVTTRLSGKLEIVAGIVLILIGARILLTHLGVIG